MSIQWKKESSNAPLKTLDFTSSKVYVLVRKNLVVTEQEFMPGEPPHKVYTYDSAFMTPLEYLEYAATVPAEFIASTNDNGSFVDNPGGLVVMNHTVDSTSNQGLWVFPIAISKLVSFDVKSTTGEKVKVTSTALGLIWQTDAPVKGKILLSAKGTK